MNTLTRNGRSIERFIPQELMQMFYRNPNPAHKYAIRNGYDPFSFPIDNLVCYLPLWALKNNVGFRSVDAYKRVCTVTGALWRPNGRFFDATDDRIVQTTLLDVMPSAVTVSLWYQPLSGADTQRFLCHKENINIQDRFWFTLEGDNTYKLTTEGNDIALRYLTMGTGTVGTWYHLVFIYEAGVTLRGYQNLTEYTGDTADTIRSGTFTNFVIGNHNLIYTYGCGGIIGEFAVWGKALSAIEVTHLNSCTKWRYS